MIVVWFFTGLWVIDKLRGILLWVGRAISGIEFYFKVLNTIIMFLVFIAFIYLQHHSIIKTTCWLITNIFILVCWVSSCIFFPRSVYSHCQVNTATIRRPLVAVRSAVRVRWPGSIGSLYIFLGDTIRLHILVLIYGEDEV